MRIYDFNLELMRVCQSGLYFSCFTLNSHSACFIIDLTRSWSMITFIHMHIQMLTDYCSLDRKLFTYYVRDYKDWLWYKIWLMVFKFLIDIIYCIY